jgi:hypothetical protein
MNQFGYIRNTTAHRRGRGKQPPAGRIGFAKPRRTG